MGFMRIMGLEVSDDEEYQRYREAMTQILKTYDGFFGYDFKVSEVLISKTPEKINRVFTIEFPNEDAMVKFFEDPAYLVAKEKHFSNSVGDVTVISLHEMAS